jgi:hypothetical protein
LFCFFGTGTWTQGLHLEPLHQPFFVMGIFKIGSRRLASNLDPPDLCLLSSRDYRREPPRLALIMNFLKAPLSLSFFSFHLFQDWLLSQRFPNDKLHLSLQRT